MTVRRTSAARAFAAASLALVIAIAAALARQPAPAAEKAGAEKAGAEKAGAEKAGVEKAGAPARAAAASFLARLPLSFEANRGQWDGEALFRVAGRGGTAFVTRSGAVFALPGDPPEDAGRRPGTALARSSRRAGGERGGEGAARSGPRREAAAFRMRVEGASADASAEGLEELPGKANFFLGNDRSRWRSNVSTYARAKVSGIRPGVDVVYYGREGQLEYDFALEPGVDPATVRLAFEGIDSLDVNGDGDLVVRVAGREVLQRRPQVYEEGPAGRRALGAAYVMLPGNAVAFRVEGRDPARRLVIDPVIVFGTLLGGSGWDEARAIGVDASGDVLVAGVTYDASFPVFSGLGKPFGGSGEGFVAKVKGDGRGLVFSTYLGGSAMDGVTAIAVDAAGCPYVTGYTDSGDFPTTRFGVQTSLAGVRDAFLTWLAADGSAINYSTYVGGASGDTGLAIAVDGEGSAYITGSTASPDFPTAGPIQSPLPGIQAAFATKLSPRSGIVYSTYLGGTLSPAGAYTYGTAIAVDGAGSAYLTGYTVTMDFPTTAGAFQRAIGSGTGQWFDAFVAKLSPSGGALVYSTYLGGSSHDSAASIAVDATGSAYVAGTSQSLDFPAAHALQPGSNGGGDDAFVTRLTPDGAGLVFSTYLGGAGGDAASALVLDGTGRILVAGSTGSGDFPTVAPVQGSHRGGFDDAFLAKLEADGSRLVFSTYLGGSGSDRVDAMAVDAAGAVLLGGRTNSPDFPVVPAQAANAASLDALVLKLSGPTLREVSQATGPAVGGATVTLSGDQFASGATVTFGGVAAPTVTVVDAATITAVTPAHAAGAVDVVVTNPGGIASTLAAAYTFVPAPAVLGAYPASCPTGGGRILWLEGSGFQAGATVTLGGTAAAGVSVESATSLTFTAPAHAAGVFDVVVTNPDGQTGTLTGGFTFLAPPSIASVAPERGSTEGSTTITLTGTAFQSGASVWLGETMAVNVNVTSPTSITATTLPHAAGMVDLLVVNPDGQSATAAAAYTYFVPPPVVTVIAPAAGTSAGGTLVALAGTGFQDGATVSFGGTASRLVTVSGATRLTASTPQHPPGNVDVVVTNPDGQSATVADGFTYFPGNAPAPTLRAAGPAAGPVAGGTRVTLTGTGFQAGMVVSFGGTLATAVTVDSGTSATATAPAHAAGLVDIAVSNADGQSATLARAFAYYPAGAPAPTVAGVSPASGLEGGGWGVTVTGTGFMPGATVAFGGAPGTGISVASDTALTATMPPHAPGPADVVVTNPDGQSGTRAGGVEFLRNGGSGCGYLGSDGSLALLLALAAAGGVRLRRRETLARRRAGSGGA